MKSIIEGLLFVSGDEGITLRQMAEVLELDEESTAWAIEELREDCRREGRGLQIVVIAGAYQFTTLPEHAPYFERLAYSPTRSALSQAALETLAIIAYRQPITRIDIEEIRGVKSDRAIHTLVAKQLVEEVGRAEAIGRPILYGTTRQFLDYFALNNLQDLPDTSDFGEQNLEEETKQLFEKLDGRQLTIDELP